MPRYHNFILGGVEVGLSASQQVTQTYETIGGRSLRRKLSGAAHMQTAWAKLRTTLSGSGRLPEGLSGLDYSTSLSLSCLAPLSIWTATTSATLPAARRSDVPPRAWAIVNGLHIPTPMSLSVNTATLTAVTGASGYVVAYWPVLTVYAAPPRLDFNGRDPTLGWTIEAEEA